MSNDALVMSDIEKSFSGVKVLSKVSFILKEGEVHALLGENGAGKSTLMKILGGIYKADSGNILIDGQTVKIDNVQDAQKYGISIIHQELCLANNISIAENIFMGREPIKNEKLKIVDYDKMNEQAQKLLDDIGLSINADKLVSDLSIAQQQMVEICKSLSFKARFIVMDEPTSSLSSNEITKLFKLISQLKKEKVSIIFISHKIEELFQIADRVTVLRDGRVIDTKEVAFTNNAELIKLMVGRSIADVYIKSKPVGKEPLLEVRNLTTRFIHNVSFTLKKGEILGLSGLVGAGRTELARAIFGVDKVLSGEIFLEGKKLNIKTPEEAIKNGIVLIPENRKKSGLVLINTVGFNITLGVLDHFINFCNVDIAKELAIINEFLDKLNIKTAGYRQKVLNVSGGNQQKIVLAKWLATDPKVLIMDEPTRGIDVGAKYEIYNLIERLARSGIGIIIISSELPEIIGMCSRVIVMCDHRTTGLLDSESELITQEKIMTLATLS